MVLYICIHWHYIKFLATLSQKGHCTCVNEQKETMPFFSQPISTFFYALIEEKQLGSFIFTKSFSAVIGTATNWHLPNFQNTGFYQPELHLKARPPYATPIEKAFYSPQ